MIFKTLKAKNEYYRSLTDYRIMPNGIVLVMIDGKNFSKLIKNKFEKPFDKWFIETMNETALKVASQLPNCVGAYVQSDEISFIIKDNTKTEIPFDGRLCKMLSIIPSIASSFFTKKIFELEMSKRLMKNELTGEWKDPFDGIDKMPEYVFDCKVWNIPNQDALGWFLYRQIDCIRNSKQQFCQTYLPHKELMNKNTDEQVQLCLEKTGNDWNKIDESMKYGRFFYKGEVVRFNDDGESYVRKNWFVESYDLTLSENREDLFKKWLKDEEGR